MVAHTVATDVVDGSSTSMQGRGSPLEESEGPSEDSRLRYSTRGSRSCAEVEAARDQWNEYYISLLILLNKYIVLSRIEMDCVYAAEFFRRTVEETWEDYSIGMEEEPVSTDGRRPKRSIVGMLRAGRIK